jgi:hypothetical protein
MVTNDDEKIKGKKERKKKDYERECASNARVNEKDSGRNEENEREED